MGKTLQLPEEVLQNVVKCQNAILAVKTSMTQLKAATSRKGNVLSEGEFLRSAEVEDLLQQVSSMCPLVMGASTASDKLRANLGSAMEMLNGLATAAQNGDYDTDRPPVQVSHCNLLLTLLHKEPFLLDADSTCGLGCAIQVCVTVLSPSLRFSGHFSPMLLWIHVCT